MEGMCAHECRIKTLTSRKYCFCDKTHQHSPRIYQKSFKAAVLNWGYSHPQEEQAENSWGANFSSLTINISNVNTKNITSNDARGAKMVFPSGRGAGFKVN